MKPEYRKHSREFDTEWLGSGISISDKDFSVLNNQTKAINRFELKLRDPILTRCQMAEFRYGLFHVVVHFNKELYNEEGQRDFKSDYFHFYCPHRLIKVEKVIDDYDTTKIKGYRLIQKSIKIGIKEAWYIFRADVYFPCCQKFTIHPNLEKHRSIFKED